MSNVGNLFSVCTRLFLFSLALLLLEVQCSWVCCIGILHATTDEMLFLRKTSDKLSTSVAINLKIIVVRRFTGRCNRFFDVGNEDR
jgi:hypothetical protein